MNGGISRRAFLKAASVATGAAVGARAPGESWIREAAAATEPSSVVLVYFMGGYSAIFGSAAPLAPALGVGGNFASGGSFGPGVSFDNTLASAFSDYVRQHLAVIGVDHKQSSHPAAKRAIWSEGRQNAAHLLASVMGGASPNKALICGGTDFDPADRPQDPVNGVAFERQLDMRAYVDAIGASAAAARDPSRQLVRIGVERAERMSARELTGSPGALSPLAQGFRSALAGLDQPSTAFDLEALQTAYRLTGPRINSFASKLAAAELFVRTGVNVVSIFERGWDTHGDNDGSRSRRQMAALAPDLKIFLDRMINAQATKNVVVCLLGDFARSLPGSDHQPNLSATVIGRTVKAGTTGRVNGNVALPPGRPGARGLWSYLASAAKSEQNPFGANPHGLLL
jgi:hypothetical protein